MQWHHVVIVAEIVAGLYLFYSRVGSIYQKIKEEDFLLLGIPYESTTIHLIQKTFFFHGLDYTLQLFYSLKFLHVFNNHLANSVSIQKILDFPLELFSAQSLEKYFLP